MLQEEEHPGEGRDSTDNSAVRGALAWPPTSPALSAALHWFSQHLLGCLFSSAAMSCFPHFCLKNWPSRPFKAKQRRAPFFPNFKTTLNPTHGPSSLSSGSSCRPVQPGSLTRETFCFYYLEMFKILNYLEP